MRDDAIALLLALAIGLLGIVLIIHMFVCASREQGAEGRGGAAVVFYCPHCGAHVDAAVTASLACDKSGQTSQKETALCQALPKQ